jgi:hypothetical protein
MPRSIFADPWQHGKPMSRYSRECCRLSVCL